MTHNTLKIQNRVKEGEEASLKSRQREEMNGTIEASPHPSTICITEEQIKIRTLQRPQSPQDRFITTDHNYSYHRQTNISTFPMPLSFYPSRQQTHTLAMVVDGTRIPAPSPSRSRLSRPAQPSRIPPPRSNTSTPRRPTRPLDNPNTPTSARRANDTNFISPRSQTTPIRSDLRSPRDPRKQKDFASPRDPRKVPLRRTPVKPTDRTDPPSSRTPRRTAAAPRSNEDRAQRTGIPAPRRMSKEPPQRVGVPRYGSRLSASSQEPPKARARTALNNTSRFQSQHSNIPHPSPVKQSNLPQPRRLSNTPRPGLSPSPYARRTSNGGNIRTMAGVTPRRLNMAHADDDRRLSNTTTTATATARRLSAAKDRLADRVETRRESLTGARRESLTGPRRESLTGPRRESLTGTRRESLPGARRGLSALESFRAARRASLEAEKGKQNQDTGDIVMTDVTPAPNPVYSASPVPVAPDPVAALEQTLPDRQDPLGLGSVPLTSNGKPRRKSTRFSDADICLDGVEQLRKSLGRRRSVGYGERIPEDMETPTLRRSSIGERLKLQAELEKQEEAERQAALERERQRLPLGSLEYNKENMQSVDDKTEKRRSLVPMLEGAEYDWTNEDVEDLGPDNCS